MHIPGNKQGGDYHPRGRNLTLNRTQGEMGVSLKKEKKN